jgi:hypothetical protein
MILMTINKRAGLVAPCGIDCGTCELNLSKDNPPLLAYLVSKGIPKEKLPCEGCRNIKGDCPVIGAKCATYICATEKEADFCFNCSDFPCVKLQPSADRADILPHNMKVFNLCTIKRVGTERFVEISTEIKQRYYKGKMAVGKGPQI